MTEPLKAENVQHNAYTQDMAHNEFVAVDGTGTPIAKANSREAAEQAAPHHSGIFSAHDLKPQENKEPKPLPEGPAGPIGAEATAKPSENSYEKILAHVEKTRDTEANHERQLKDAEKVIAETEAAKPAGQKKAEAQAEKNHPKHGVETPAKTVTSKK